MSNPFPPRRPVYTTQPNSSARGRTKQYDRRQSVIAGHRANAYIQPTALLLFHEGAKLPFLLLPLKKMVYTFIFFPFFFVENLPISSDRAAQASRAHLHWSGARFIFHALPMWRRRPMTNWSANPSEYTIASSYTHLSLTHTHQAVH